MATNKNHRLGIPPKWWWSKTHTSLRRIYLEFRYAKEAATSDSAPEDKEAALTRKVLSLLYKVHAFPTAPELTPLSKWAHAHPGASTALYVAASVGELPAAISDPVIGGIVAAGRMSDAKHSALMMSTLRVEKEAIQDVVKALITGVSSGLSQSTMTASTRPGRLIRPKCLNIKKEFVEKLAAVQDEAKRLATALDLEQKARVAILEKCSAAESDLAMHGDKNLAMAATIKAICRTCFQTSNEHACRFLLIPSIVSFINHDHHHEPYVTGDGRNPALLGM